MNVRLLPEPSIGTVDIAALVDAAADGVVVLDGDGTMVIFNEAASELFGYARDEALGRHVDVLLGETARAALDEFLHRPGEARSPVVIGSGREIEGRRREGTAFSIEMTVGRLHSNGDARYVCFLRDLTERKAMERRLRQREETLHLTIENAPIPIATFDLTGRLLSANTAWCDMLGYGEVEIVGLGFQQFTHPDDVARGLALLEEARRGERDVYAFQKRYLRKDGSAVHVVLHNAMVHDAEGRPLMIVAQVEDLSERLRAEEESREHRERLAHVDRLNVMGELAASIAHEINQPLSAIANYTNAARRRLAAGKADLDKLSGSLARIDEQAQRAGAVVRHLRNLVRKRDSVRVLVDVNELVRDGVGLAEVDARIHDLSIDLRLAAVLPPVLGDPVQIEQVLLNLVRNATDAMDDPSDGHDIIRVHTRATGDGFVEVAVEDAGPGITPEQEERLFEPFFTTKKGGMGLGLSISRSIITHHGGRFWFSRNPGRGITFHFTLPEAGARG